MYVVILAGGGGTRLWPLSRVDRPKPFLPLVGGETLFQRTVARVRPLVGMDGIYVVVERRHVPHVLAQVPEFPADHVLAEPMGRNTAPAIALATLAIDRPLGEVMVVLPADAWITDDAAFRDVLQDVAGPGGLAEGSAELGVDAPLVTLGVRADPDHPQTGYGHLIPDLATATHLPGRAPGGGLAAYRLAAFVEKPDLERAGQLARREGVAWNAGMFAWRRRAIHAALERHAGDILDGVALALAAPGAGDEGGLLDGPEAARRYAAVRSTSIDYAVMEPAASDRQVLMGGMRVGWSDVGNWAAVRDLDRAMQAGAGGGASRATGTAGVDGIAGAGTLDEGSRDILVHAGGGRLVVTVGLSDTIVVDTPDALLVCSADRAQDVRAIVERLREAGETEYL